MRLHACGRFIWHFSHHPHVQDMGLVNTPGMCWTGLLLALAAWQPVWGLPSSAGTLCPDISCRGQHGLAQSSSTCHNSGDVSADSDARPGLLLHVECKGLVIRRELQAHPEVRPQNGLDVQQVHLAGRHAPLRVRAGGVPLRWPAGSPVDHKHVAGPSWLHPEHADEWLRRGAGAGDWLAAKLGEGQTPGPLRMQPLQLPPKVD